jgi:MSHA biogenesis protein MshQ
VTGDKIYIRDVAGMTQVDYTTPSVTVIDATHFSIGDTSTYSAYQSGGVALKKAATGTDLSARLVNGSISGSWLNGVATDILMSFQFSRLASGPDGRYITDFGIAPVDSDGVQLGLYDMDVVLPVGNDHATLNSTPLEIRYGRLLISNMYGSEMLALPVNVQAQYWGGSSYISNPDDSCTPLSAGNFVTAAGGGAAVTTTITGGGTMASGTGTIKLTKPSPTPAAKGNVILKTNPAASPWPIDGYLPGSGIETFGIYKAGPLIYLREIYN